MNDFDNEIVTNVVAEFAPVFGDETILSILQMIDENTCRSAEETVRLIDQIVSETSLDHHIARKLILDICKFVIKRKRRRDFDVEAATRRMRRRVANQSDGSNEIPAEDFDPASTNVFKDAKELLSDGPNKIKVLIVGAGPAGLLFVTNLITEPSLWPEPQMGSAKYQEWLKHKKANDAVVAKQRDILQRYYFVLADNRTTYARKQIIVTNNEQFIKKLPISVLSALLRQGGYGCGVAAPERRTRDFAGHLCYQNTGFWKYRKYNTSKNITITSLSVSIKFLERLLCQFLRAHGVSIERNNYITVNFSSFKATLYPSGEQFDVVIGADGNKSIVAQSMQSRRVPPAIDIIGDDKLFGVIIFREGPDNLIEYRDLDNLAVDENERENRFYEQEIILDVKNLDLKQMHDYSYRVFTSPKNLFTMSFNVRCGSDSVVCKQFERVLTSAPGESIDEKAKLFDMINLQRNFDSLCRRLGISASQCPQVKQDFSNVSVFAIEPFANEPYFTLNQPARFLIGDAAFASHYFSGSGLKYNMLTSNALVDLLHNVSPSALTGGHVSDSDRSALAKYTGEMARVKKVWTRGISTILKIQSYDWEQSRIDSDNHWVPQINNE